jgi:hypothetical protein
MSEEIVGNSVDELADTEAPERVEESTEEEVEETTEEPVEPKEEIDWEARAKKAEAKFIEAKRKYKEPEPEEKSEPPAKEAKAPLAVEDYIDISNALSGLDREQQAYISEQHRLTGKPLGELREGKEFQRWDKGYQAEVEAERALHPNSTQSVEDAPKTLAEALKNASIADKERILKEAGILKMTRQDKERVKIGNTRVG